MKFLVKLSIGLLLFFVQIGISYVIQLEEIWLSLLVTFLYGMLCESYVLGFVVGLLSIMAYFIAVGISYSIYGTPIWDVLRPVFNSSEFYAWEIFFGILGIISVKLGRWSRKKAVD